MNMTLLRRLKADNRRVVHLMFIGTKPDIIKQAPIYHALKNRNELVIVCHTGQHYDFNNSKAILKELDIRVDINFKIHGTITDKLAQIIRQTGRIISDIESCGKKVVPYVHGDTLTAHGAALGAVLVRVAPVHIEAGLRTMTPKSVIYKRHIANFAKGSFKFDKYLADIRNLKNYEHGSFEPFPEQIDTRVIDEVAAIKFAPTRLNFENIASERNLKIIKLLWCERLETDVDLVPSWVKNPKYRSKSNFHPDFQHKTKKELKEILSRKPILKQKDLTVVHGDLCPVNIIFNKSGQAVGLIDLGDMHIGDKMLDIAVLSWTIRGNFGREYETLFLRRLDINPENKTLEYYRLIYNLNLPSYKNWDWVKE